MAKIDNIKPENNNICHYRGDVFDEIWTITKDDGTAYDLSGKTLLMKIKKQQTNDTALVTMSIGDGISLSGGSNNVLTFNKVIALDSGIYYYDLEITDDNYTITYGTWEESNDTSR